MFSEVISKGHFISIIALNCSNFFILFYLIYSGVSVLRMSYKLYTVVTHQRARALQLGTVWSTE